MRHADGRCDALFSSHNIEHLYAHEVPLALREFRRVLKPEGFVVITCPDLQSICAEVAEDRLTQTAYQSPAGPIAPIDMLYGLRSALARGNLYMAHRSGFTLKVLVATLRDRHPFLGTVPFVVARNQAIAREGEPLRDGDELALLPPVSGG